MKHVLRGRYLTVALVSAAAGSLAAGAFGSTAATARHPAPIRLDAGRIEHPVLPVPLDDVLDDPQVVSPAAVSPMTIDTPEPPTPASPASIDSAPTVVEPAPAPAPTPRPAPASPAIDPDSPDSPASVGSIDS